MTITNAAQEAAKAVFEQREWSAPRFDGVACRRARNLTLEEREEIIQLAIDAETKEWREIAEELAARLDTTDNHLLHCVGPTTARTENKKALARYNAKVKGTK